MISNNSDAWVLCSCFML